MKKMLNVFRRKEKSYNLNLLHEKIELVRKKSTILDLCAEPTGYSWLGVRNAAFSLFPDNTVEIPQYYSNQIITDEDLKKIGHWIADLGFEKLIFNGFNCYFTKIIDAALSGKPELEVSWIHHGFPAELSGNKIMIQILNVAVEYHKTNKIGKIGFIKKNFDLFFQKRWGCKTFPIILPTPVNRALIRPEKFKIGVMLSNDFRKNYFTQVLAADLFEGALIKLSYPVDGYVFKNKSELLGELSHQEFLNELGGNTINTHVTFSEASGGQVFSESLGMGVPCLTSLTHGFLDDNQYLKDLLVVSEFDDVWAIHHKMRELIERRDELSPLCIQHTEEMNIKAQKLLKEFLEA